MDFNLCSFSSLEPSKLENRNLEILSSDLNEFRKLLKNTEQKKWQMLKIDWKLKKMMMWWMYITPWKKHNFIPTIENSSLG
jgi:hypothetical protein